MKYFQLQDEKLIYYKKNRIDHSKNIIFDL